MLGYYLKTVKVLSATATEGFKLPAESRMACTLSITGAVSPVLEHSLDGTTWSAVTGITLAAGITGWNLYNSSTLPPLPLIRITAASGMTAVTVSVVE